VDGGTFGGGGGYLPLEGGLGGEAPTIVLAMPLVVPLDAGDAGNDGADDGALDAANDGLEDAAVTSDGAVCTAGEVACPIWTGCGTFDLTACYAGARCREPPACPPR
jgi:hypothetical protein